MSQKKQERLNVYFRNDDIDVWEFLNKQSNKSAYVIELIRNDMQGTSNQPINVNLTELKESIMSEFEKLSNQISNIKVMAAAPMDTEPQQEEVFDDSDIDYASSLEFDF